MEKTMSSLLRSAIAGLVLICLNIVGTASETSAQNAPNLGQAASAVGTAIGSAVSGFVGGVARDTAIQNLNLTKGLSMTQTNGYGNTQAAQYYDSTVPGDKLYQGANITGGANLTQNDGTNNTQAVQLAKVTSGAFAIQNQTVDTATLNQRGGNGNLQTLQGIIKR